MTGRTGFYLAMLLVVASGCETATSPPAVTLTASKVRAERRLYDGAPPVIPHAPLNIKCVECHTDTGKEAPPLGFAPANPHGRSEGLSSAGFCQQCHVFRRQEDLFAESDFVGLAQQFSKAGRLYPGAPPVIPHRVFMRENCNSCHTGPASRPEIRCSHPLRANCRQCHVPADETEPMRYLSAMAVDAASPER